MIGQHKSQHLFRAFGVWLVFRAFRASLPFGLWASSFSFNPSVDRRAVSREDDLEVGEASLSCPARFPRTLFCGVSALEDSGEGEDWLILSIGLQTSAR